MKKPPNGDWEYDAVSRALSALSGHRQVIAPSVVQAAVLLDAGNKGKNGIWKGDVMKKLELIGGMGPESTIPYYHDIVYGVQNRIGKEFFPNLTIETPVYNFLIF